MVKDGKDLNGGKNKIKKAVSQKLSEHRNNSIDSQKNNDQELQQAISLISNFKTNFYQKIYKLAFSDTESWEYQHFLSNDEKKNNFISSIEREVRSVKSKKFNMNKYKKAIEIILGLKNSPFNDEIIKNMYIAKLQNIMFMLKKQSEEGDELKEVKETSQDLLR